MCDQIKNASLEWQDERTPISIKFDEPYFSIFNGLDETRHVFLSGNNLCQRFNSGFHVAIQGMHFLSGRTYSFALNETKV